MISVKKKTIFVLAGNDKSLVNFRGPLLSAMAQIGHIVVAAAPQESETVTSILALRGVRFLSVPIERAGMNPILDGSCILRLKAILLKEKPCVMLGYTIKPVIYGSLVASWTGVPEIYALITGLGAAFYTGGLKGRLMRFVATTMYRFALSRCSKVFVQNKDIASFFIRERIVVADKVVIVPGSGVDTQHFGFVPASVSPKVFLLLARMLHDKGIKEYVAAARLVKAVLPEARFLLVGDTDPNPAAISQNQLKDWNEEGVIEYCAAVADVRPLLSICTAYVLPSYHEGLPRSVLEAMSVGRPIVTTDTIGCRETIMEAVPCLDLGQGILQGLNGFLVPVRSVDSLAVAMLRLARDRSLALEMGRQSRLIAESRFDVHRVNDLMLRAMNLAPGKSILSHLHNV